MKAIFQGHEDYDDNALIRGQVYEIDFANDALYFVYDSSGEKVAELIDYVPDFLIRWRVVSSDTKDKDKETE